MGSGSQSGHEVGRETLSVPSRYFQSRAGFWCRRSVLAAILSFMGAAPPALPADTLLQTGGGQVVNRVFIPLSVPPQYPSASVRFEVSFESNEQIVPGEFIDSFTMSLQNSNQTIVASILTVDAFGFLWTPSSPGGGLPIPDEDVLREDAGVNPPSTNVLFEVSYLVRVELPSSVLIDSPMLSLTLIDNLDADSSQAVVSNLVVKPGLQMVVDVESSAQPGGAYAREGGVAVDLLRDRMALTKAGATRCFRLTGETPSQITGLQFVGNDTVIYYDADLGTLDLELLGSDNPNGSFTPVLNAQFDLNAMTVSVPLLNAPAFFRISGNHPVRITNDEVSGEFRILDFDARPNPPHVESSARGTRPYAREMLVVSDPFAQTLTLHQGAAVRFYRLAGEVPVSVKGVGFSGPDVTITYDENP